MDDGGQIKVLAGGSDQPTDRMAALSPAHCARRVFSNISVMIGYKGVKVGKVI